MRITFTGVSPRSLGDFLKGYGLIAVLGETWPDACFFWDSAGHLVVHDDSLHDADCIKNVVCESLPSWAASIGRDFAPERGDKGQNKKKVPSKLTRQANFDGFSSMLAEVAWGAAVPDRPTEKADTRSHPWFGAHGQEGSGDYFAQLGKVAETLKKAAQPPCDSLEWSLFRQGSIRHIVRSGGVFFPQPMKRYATGVKEWVREGDAPVSAWCYALAVRGALFLRGSLRRMRFARSDYPAFPFLFEGARGWEIHLPVWNERHPRKLAELRLQIAQFQVRITGDAVAANAAEFRAAVVSRGISTAFDRFYRFVLEERRPGQQQYLQQAILRGVTYVGRPSTADVRLLVAPLAQRGWLNRLETKGRLGKSKDPAALKRCGCRQLIEDAIHAAIDEPLLERFVGILEQLWAANRLLATQAKGAESSSPILPSPPLDTAAWERALGPLLRRSPEHRIARAIGSILGASTKGEKQVGNDAKREDTSNAAGAARESQRKRIGGLLTQLLLLDERGNWDKERSTDVIAWDGLDPNRDFGELLWRRWLHSAKSGIDRLALRARRVAPLNDVVSLLEGKADLAAIHRLVPLYALLDWQKKTEVAEQSSAPADAIVISPSYAILRCWLHLAINPPEGEAGERDGAIVRLLVTRRAREVSRATALALRRLRIYGLPTDKGDDRPFGKTVVQAEPIVSPEDARRLALAVLVPISSHDVLILADRLTVKSPERILKEVIA